MPRNTGYSLSPPATVMVDGVEVLGDVPLHDAAQTNRRMALGRIASARSGALPVFQDVLAHAAPPFHEGDSLAAVNGDPNFGRQGAPRQAFEVLSYCYEVMRYGELPHGYDHRLYTCELHFPIRGVETFVIPANIFGRLRRAWESAVFVRYNLAEHLDVLFAHEPGIEEYPSELLEAAYQDDRLRACFVD